MNNRKHFRKSGDKTPVFRFTFTGLGGLSAGPAGPACPLPPLID